MLSIYHSLTLLRLLVKKNEHIQYQFYCKQKMDWLLIHKNGSKSNCPFDNPPNVARARIREYVMI